MRRAPTVGGLTDWNDLPVAVRAWTEPKLQTPGTSPKAWPLPESILVFDTETTIDHTQQLNFGCWRYLRVDYSETTTLTCVREGLFYADNLADRFPVGLDTLVDYQRSHRPDVDTSVPDSARDLQLIPQNRFVDEVLLKAVYDGGVWVIGFNLPFDISRVAVDVGPARKHPDKDRDLYEGGFSFTMSTYTTSEGEIKERSQYRPRIVIKTIDSKRHLIGIRHPLHGDPHRVGRFLDLRTLTFALTDESFSLARACETFGVEHPKLETTEHGVITDSYIDYCRRDVQATSELFGKVIDEYRRHDIDLPPSSAFSPASIGKAYLRKMGIKPPLRRNKTFPKEVLGYAMASYYGGRAECHIRKTRVPVVYCDFLSMYPTVNSLMGLWDFLTAETVTTEDRTDASRDLLASITIDDCFLSATWKEFTVLCELDPDEDVVPVRADYSGHGNWQIGLNPLRADTSMWYALPDLIASKLLTGRTPQIKKAIGLKASAKKASGLSQVNLRSEISVDPKTRISSSLPSKRGSPSATNKKATGSTAHSRSSPTRRATGSSPR